MLEVDILPDVQFWIILDVLTQHNKIMQSAFISENICALV